MPNLTPAIKTHRTPCPARQRGSAMVLSIVTIVMMAILGGAFLQMARLDRRSAASVDTRSNVSESSILRFIGQILAGDIPEGLEDPDVEPHDYPISNVASPWLVPDRFAPITVPGPQPGANDLPARDPRGSGNFADPAGNLRAQGNSLDDTWLASNEPVTVGGNLRWPHVTNLTGVFLDLDTLVTDPGPFTGMFPTQYLSTADDDPQSGDTNAVPAIGSGTPAGIAAAGRFADADGDGILDSRWTWAPLPSDGGVAFVMAVRVIDNSALIDLNTWSDIPNRALTDPQASRWLWPGELELNRPLTELGTAVTPGTVPTVDLTPTEVAIERGLASNQIDNRVFNWLEASALPFRPNGANNLGEYDGFGNAAERMAGAMGEDLLTNPNSTYERFGLRTDELELRWRNGLNRTVNSAALAPTPLEALAPALFRNGNPEDAFGDTPFNTPLEFLFNEPRKKLTTISGSADFGRVDLNTAEADELADVFAESLGGAGAVDQDTPLVYRFRGGAPNNNADVQRFADQMAAIAIDYRDPDSILTRMNDTWGMEYLPFVSEVYLQVRYGTSAVTPVAPAFQVQWSNPQDFAAAIELVNPFPWAIDVPDVELLVDTENWGTLTDLLPAGTTQFAANERIVLVRSDPGGDNSQLPVAGPLGAGPAQAVDVPAGRNWPISPEPAAIDIVLQAIDDQNQRVVYQRFGTETVSEVSTDPGALDTYAADPNADVGGEGYRQSFAQSTAVSFAPMAVNTLHGDGDLFVSSPPVMLNGELDWRRVDSTGIAGNPTIANPGPMPARARVTANGPANHGPESRLGEDTKPLAGFDDRVLPPGPLNDRWVIGNGRRFNRTGEVLDLVAIGPRIQGANVLTVGEVWQDIAEGVQTLTGGATPDYSLFNTRIRLYEDEPGMPIPGFAGQDVPGVDIMDGARRITHAAYYLQRFSTVPVNNGRRGLVSGRLNLNTASAQALSSALPLANATTATNLANAIVLARTPAPTAVNNNVDDNGIAVVGELAVLPEVLNLSGTPTGNTEIQDYNEAEPELGPGATPAADNGVGDNEEHGRLLTALNQVASTRSDIFTAHVFVRGYPANDFSMPPTTQFRLIAVFDRSQASAGGVPRILAARRFAD